jgi:hypothetical protein
METPRGARAGLVEGGIRAEAGPHEEYHDLPRPHAHR